MAFEKCKRCGFMHYSTDPCKETVLPSKRGESSGGDERATAVTTKDSGLQRRPIIQVDTQAEGRTRAAPKPKFDRNAYQRDYMRNIYRPSKKLKLPNTPLEPNSE